MFGITPLGRLAKRQKLSTVDGKGSNNPTPNRDFGGPPAVAGQQSNPDVNITAILKAYGDKVMDAYINDILRYELFFSSSYNKTIEKNRAAKPGVSGFNLPQINYLLHQWTLEREKAAIDGTPIYAFETRTTRSTWRYEEIDIQWILTYLNYNGICITDHVMDKAEKEREINFATQAETVMGNVFGGEINKNQQATARKRLHLIIKEVCLPNSQEIYYPSSLSEDGQKLNAPKDQHVFRVIPVITDTRHVCYTCMDPSRETCGAAGEHLGTCKFNIPLKSYKKQAPMRINKDGEYGDDGNIVRFNDGTPIPLLNEMVAFNGLMAEQAEDIEKMETTIKVMKAGKKPIECIKTLDSVKFKKYIEELEEGGNTLGFKVLDKRLEEGISFTVGYVEENKFWKKKVEPGIEKTAKKNKQAIRMTVKLIT